ncbi:MAG: phosphoribosylanthranilate isomerase [Legionella sp.]|uniref:phosphoribosylanthranilate isomerase n=1 Tax=Legionella sp. TaxID=459 RepID=UPI0039E54F1E
MNHARVRVKMCGMTRQEDIAHAVHLGVDAIGLIFYPQSKRYVSIEQAKKLLKDLPPFVDTVAVVVNPECDLVHQIISELPIRLVQFHGEESVVFCQQFNKPFIKSVSAESTAHIEQAAQEYVSAQALLLDTPAEHEKGGTGLCFDWGIIPNFMPKSYLLAGGLNEFNVLEVLKICHPYALDLCSGIEAAPGIKDHNKMSRFMNQLATIK